MGMMVNCERWRIWPNMQLFKHLWWTESPKITKKWWSNLKMTISNSNTQHHHRLEWERIQVLCTIKLVPEAAHGLASLRSPESTEASSLTISCHEFDVRLVGAPMDGWKLHYGDLSITWHGNDITMTWDNITKNVTITYSKNYMT